MLLPLPLLFLPLTSRPVAVSSTLGLPPPSTISVAFSPRNECKPSSICTECTIDRACPCRRPCGTSCSRRACDGSVSWACAWPRSQSVARPYAAVTCAGRNWQQDCCWQLAVAGRASAAAAGDGGSAAAAAVAADGNWA